MATTTASEKRREKEEKRKKEKAKFLELIKSKRVTYIHSMPYTNICEVHVHGKKEPEMIYNRTMTLTMKELRDMGLDKLFGKAAQQTHINLIYVKRFDGNNKEGYVYFRDGKSVKVKDRNDWKNLEKEFNKEKEELQKKFEEIEKELKEKLPEKVSENPMPDSYMDISNFHKGFASFSLDGKKWGVISATGEKIIEPKYDETLYLGSGLMRVREGDRFGIIKKGKLVTTSLDSYQDIRECHDERIAVKKNDKWGFLDEECTLVIPCIYDEVLDFHHGISLVIYTYKDLRILIDKTGQFVHAFLDFQTFSESEKLSAILSRCYREEKYFSHIIKSDQFGLEFQFNYLFNHDYDEVRPFTKGKYVVRKKDQYGICNVEKKFDVDFGEYDWIGEFIGKRAIVRRGEKYGAINADGEIAISPTFCRIHDFSDGLAFATKDDNKWGFIDVDGEELIGFAFNGRYFSKFEDGVANVCFNGKSFWINKKGGVFLNAPRSYKEWLSRKENADTH